MVTRSVNFFSWLLSKVNLNEMISHTGGKKTPLLDPVNLKLVKGAAVK